MLGRGMADDGPSAHPTVSIAETWGRRGGPGCDETWSGDRQDRTRRNVIERRAIRHAIRRRSIPPQRAIRYAIRRQTIRHATGLTARDPATGHSRRDGP